MLSLATAVLSLSVQGVESSSITLRSLEITLLGDTLETIIEVSGVQGNDRLLGRMVQGFDPAYQSLELLEAEFGLSGSSMGPVPDWAVDTLSGSGVWPLSLVVAWPALREGMEVRYRLRLLDWGGTWSMGPWVVVPPEMRGITPDFTSVVIRGDIPSDHLWEGECYTARRSGGGLEFTSATPSDTLWFTPFRTWGDLEDLLVSQTSPFLSGAFPPDLREAALLTTVAGTDPWMQQRLARSLICNSMELMSGPSEGGPLNVRSLQEILDSRRGTALEHALLYAAICRELGLEAVILPATGRRPALPVPSGWDRFLVRTREPGENGSLLVEPSAYLSSAFYIHRPDTLFVLDEGELLTLRPTGVEENMLREEWDLDPAGGGFDLSVDCRGWFDMTLRRMTAGRSPAELLLIVSSWTWRSGRQAAPGSVTVTDPYDLGMNAGLMASGTWCSEGGGSYRVELLPILHWDMPETMGADIVRTWRIPGRAVPDPAEGLSAEYRDGTTVLTLSGSCSRPPAVLLGTTE